MNPFCRARNSILQNAVFVIHVYQESQGAVPGLYMISISGAKVLIVELQP